MNYILLYLLVKKTSLDIIIMYVLQIYTYAHKASITRKVVYIDTCKLTFTFKLARAGVAGEPQTMSSYKLIHP